MNLETLPAKALAVLCQHLDGKDIRTLARTCRDLRDKIFGLEREKGRAAVQLEFTVEHGQDALDSDEDEQMSDEDGDFGYGLFGGGGGRRRETDPRKDAFTYKIYHSLTLHTPEKPAEAIIREEGTGWEDIEKLEQKINELVKTYRVEQYDFIVYKTKEEDNEDCITEAEYYKVSNVMQSVVSQIHKASVFSLANVPMKFTVPDVVHTYKAYFTEAEDGFSMYTLLDAVSKAGVKDVYFAGWTDWNEMDNDDIIPRFKYLKFEKFDVEVRFVQRTELDMENEKKLIKRLNKFIMTMMAGKLRLKRIRLKLVAELFYINKIRAALAKMGKTMVMRDSSDWRLVSGSFANAEDSCRVSWNSSDHSSIEIIVEKQQKK